MSDLLDLERPIAVAYLHRGGDEANRCLLTQRQLIVVLSGKPYRFERKRIKLLAFEERRAWLPLILGGIVAPFALLAIFLNLYNPWTMILLFLPALLLLYYGWYPYPVLAVHDDVKPHDFRLPFVSDNLRAFTQFVNRMIHQQDQSIYHVARAQDWQAAQSTGTYAPASLSDEGFIHASQAEQLTRLRRSGLFSPEEDWVVLIIDPVQVRAEIKYEAPVHLAGNDANIPTHPEELFPHIYGPLNTDAVVRAEPLPL